MNSTEQILTITDEFGEDRKRELFKALKIFRTQVKREMVYETRQGIKTTLERVEKKYN